VSKDLKPGDPCPKCNNPVKFGWPNLRQSGREEPQDLICPVCDTLFDSRPGKAKHSSAGPGGKFTGGHDPGKAGSYP